MSQIIKSAAGSGGVVTSVTGANGVTVSPTTGAVVVSGVNATTTTVGVASFNPADFTVNGAGQVSTITGPSSVVSTITGNSGSAAVPDGSNNINIVGIGSITAVSGANTDTIQLTGLTNHAVLVGAGTATITKIASTANTGAVLQNNSNADPSYSTATYPSTTTINQILYSSANNVVSGLATANNGILTTGTTGIPVINALSSNGQIIIGSGSGAPIAATLTPGTGITITNAANSITISATGGSFAWVDVTTATQTMAIQTGYVTDHTNVTYTLPATAALGDQIRVVGKLGITTIAQNAGQQILMSSASSTVGVTGSIVGTNVGDCVWLVCVTSGASTIWRGESFVGNWTVS
jgi:hypothetical protein